MKTIFENKYGKVDKDAAGRLYVTDKDGTREIKSVFDYAGLKNIFPDLMRDA